LTFLEAADDTIHDLHSFMLLRHGRVVAEGWWSPYAPEHPHMLFSLSKSFTSTAIGLAVAEGRLSVDDFVASHMPHDFPADMNEQLAALRVCHLLTMTSGHDPETVGVMFNQPEGNWARGFLDQPMTHAPGSHFFYENGAAYLLSAVVQQVTGMTMLDYLQRHLFEPLGIDDATWTVCPRGINIGFTGLSLTTEGIARFGQLYLQKGMWQGQRLLSETWVEEATKHQVSNGTNPKVDEEQGYGYLFWRIRHGAYRGDGMFGQFCIVLPDQDAVLAITGGKEGMEVIQDLVWAHVLPAMTTRVLPEDSSSQQALSKKLANLSIASADGQATSPVAPKASGRIYDLRAHDQNTERLSFDFGNGPFDITVASIAFDFDHNGCICTLRDDRNSHQIACGHDQWRRGMTTFNSTDGHTSQPVAASGAWTADDIYELKCCFVETAFCSTLTCHFVADTITIDWHENANCMDWQILQLRGRAVWES
jgi:CubicO group peptidase (beta-lactamase class C family)